MWRKTNNNKPSEVTVCTHWNFRGYVLTGSSYLFQYLVHVQARNRLAVLLWQEQGQVANFWQERNKMAAAKWQHFPQILDLVVCA